MADDAKKYTFRCYPSKDKDRQVIDILNSLDKEKVSYRDFICDAILFYQNYHNSDEPKPSSTPDASDIEKKLDVMKDQILSELKTNVSDIKDLIANVSIISSSDVSDSQTTDDSVSVSDDDTIPDNALDFLMGF